MLRRLALAALIESTGRTSGTRTIRRRVLVGSIYFGLLFTLDEDRVVAIFLGAMAF